MKGNKSCTQKIFFSLPSLLRKKEGKREGGRHGVCKEERRKEEWGEYLCEIREKAVLKIIHFVFFYNFIHTCTFLMD